MNAAKVTLTATILAAALGLALGLAAAPAMADKPDPEHKHGGDENPPPLETCLTSPCIADVGKTYRDNTPARRYAGEFGYIKIESNEFDKILETLPEGVQADALCEAYDVLIFNWSSPTIKKLNWQRLLDYMLCGGNVIFEDPKHVGALAAGAVGSVGVSTFEVTLHSRGDFPLSITLKVSTGTGVDGPRNDITDPLPFVNKHIIFDVDSSNTALMPFLSLPDSGDEVVGLYGDFLPGAPGGRIVLTGPDNNFHGDDMPYAGDPEADAKINHYDLLFNEIDWLLQ